MPNDHATGDTGKKAAPVAPKPTPAKKAAPKASPKATEPPFGSQGVITAQHPDASGTHASVTVGQFAADVLAGLGYPVTAENVRAFQAWAQAEGGHAAFNPLNTTQHASGASNYNSVGVKNYTSYAQGVAATVQTLKNGHYGQILTALASGKSAMAVAQGVAASPWGTGQGVIRVLGGKVSDLAVNGTAEGAAAGGAGGQALARSGTAGIPTQLNPNPTISIQTYGYIAQLAKTEPDLAALMTKYASEDLSNSSVVQRLQADIQNTHWWKSHDDAYRTAEILKAQDPATYQANIEAQINGLRDYATQFMVPLSDASVKHWAGLITDGKFTADDYKEYVKEQAKSMFPSASAGIDKGVTTTAYFDPYRQAAAQTLEVTPNSIDLMKDPKFKLALNQVDPKTGQRTAMGLADFDTYLRKLPEYAKTHQANQQAAAFGNSILQTFGKIAT